MRVGGGVGCPSQLLTSAPTAAQVRQWPEINATDGTVARPLITHYIGGMREAWGFYTCHFGEA